MTRLLQLTLLQACLLPVACGGGGSSAAPPLSATENRPGGDTTVFNTSNDAFGFPAANLDAPRSDSFFVGNSFFNTNWVTAPSSTVGRDGLGPLFNARSCSACHLRDGRGQPGEGGATSPSLLFKLGRPAPDADGTSAPDPVYGDQLQPFSILGVDPEGEVLTDWVEEPGSFGDGDAFSLRRPVYRAEGLAYGPLAADTVPAPRVAPAVFGLGLLASIPEQAILDRADPADADGDGISGRPNLVRHRATGQFRPGRFGWKANQPTLRQQSAAAFHGDLGLTTSVFPDEGCTPAQADCNAAPNGGSPEISDDILDFVDFYMHTLAVPGRREPDDPQVRRGREVFFAARCDSCHVSTWRTGTNPDFPELSNQTIHPYTDLLLHDMGEGLADGRTEFDATGREWRTPPLWGVGLVPTVNGHSFYLHDGRARNLVEAILWHGGEALASREFFRLASAEDRAALVAFLKDL